MMRIRVFVPHRLLIERDWYQLGAWNLTDDGTCRNCGTRCPGVFDGPAGSWGPRRLPVAIHHGASAERS